MPKIVKIALLAAFAVVSVRGNAATTGNLLTNPGAETGTIAGWTPGGQATPQVDDGSFDPGINPHSGKYDFLGYTSASDSLSQTQSIIVQGITAAQVDAGTTVANISFWEQGLNQGSPSDDGAVRLTFLAANGNTISTATTPTIDSHNLTWQNYSGTYAIPAGTRSITYTMLFMRNAGSDLDAFFDDNVLTIGLSSGGALSATPGALTAQVQAGSGASQQSLSLSNISTAALSFAAAASTFNGGTWLSVSPASGSVAALSSSLLVVTYNAAGLQAGVYSGSISINNGALTIPVRLSVTPTGAAMLLGQKGVVFTAIAGGASPAPQNVTVANIGSGTMNWTETLAGVTQSGSSVAQSSAPPSFTVTANTAGLVAGAYYSVAQVSAPGAANSPQSLTVVVNLLPAGSDAPVRVSPQGVILIAAQGGSASQQITLRTPSSQAVVLNAVTGTQTGGSWLGTSASSLSLSPSATLTITASSSGLAAGVYQGFVTITSSDGSVQAVISVSLVVTPGSAITANSVRGFTATACTPSKLVLAMRQLATNFQSPVGWPVNLEAQVVDDCGNPAQSATVTAAFSNGDAPLTLAYVGGGVYSATWNPATSSATNVTIQAIQAPLAAASATFNGQVATNSAAPPAIGSGGVVNAASFAPGTELAPGSIVSVFGTNLAASNGNQAGFPLPTTLGGIKLTIGGIDAPLFYAGTGQVNAQIPIELTPGTQSSIVAQAGSVTAPIVSVPESVTIGAVRPGIFIASGTQGAILNASNQLVDATHPATAGDVIVIFCTGLGATSPPTQTGQAASSGIAVVTPAVTVGGIAAGLQYAGVAPGFVGLYQVNAVIPKGVTTGPAVPVVITQSGLASNAGTIVVK